ncbi:tripartite tricarboxylate transporter substrate-binding protein [Bradyrhizobium cosmicum]|uniref:tripartite tricarboxylate transporter substrate-binding protein n=1 Tax=Bradyrhizobium cosmicum TaxID=1404864 RepID=UPI000A03C95C|nr:tripartite tricarboxylate transporter substrate-binding protein [Bradyrhizobium cosmicum]
MFRKFRSFCIGSLEPRIRSTRRADWIGAGLAQSAITAGNIRALAVASKIRHPLLPDVPTLDETGLKGFEALLCCARLHHPGLDSRSLQGLRRERGREVDADREEFGRTGELS